MKKKFLITFSTFVLIFIIVLVDYVIDAKKPIEIYPINKMTIILYDRGFVKYEYFCVYNYRGKSEKELIDSIQAYDARTSNIDTIIKYKSLYGRYFYKNSNNLTKDLYVRDDPDKMMDFADISIMSIRREFWRGRENNDSLIWLNVGGNYFNVSLKNRSNLNKIVDTRLLTNKTP